MKLFAMPTITPRSCAPARERSTQRSRVADSRRWSVHICIPSLERGNESEGAYGDTLQYSKVTHV